MTTGGLKGKTMPHPQSDDDECGFFVRALRVAIQQSGCEEKLKRKDMAAHEEDSQIGTGDN